MLELLISLAILGVLLSGVYSAFVTQTQNSTREFKVAQTEMELGIGKNIIERDLLMAGYGLADDYSAAPIPVPRVAAATNAVPDTLTVTGTALGMESQVAQGWTYLSAVAAGPPPVPSFATWADSREDVGVGDSVIIMEPGTKKFLTELGVWKFTYNGSNVNLTPGLSIPSLGTLVYGVDSAAALPYATVAYSLSGANLPTNCEATTMNLVRAETWTAVAGAPNPLLTCVLDFQVAFGLDTDEDINKQIDLWDNGGVTAGGYDSQTLKRRLKQIRAYLLVQVSNRDTDYTFPVNTIRVGESLLATGGDVALSPEQRKYKWKVINMTITPRNIR